MENEVTCFVLLSARYFRSSINKLKNAIDALNCERVNRPKHQTTLNEWYRMLNSPYTPPIAVGDRIGWDSYKSNKVLIDFEIFTDFTVDERPVTIIQLLPNPEYLAPKFEEEES